MPTITDTLLKRIVPSLAKVPGVVAVVLGGSRARGTANEASDYDIGLYFESAEPLDTESLLNVVRTLVDDPVSAAVTPVGEWGPRIVGGGWLSVAGRKVDLLYRNIERVATVIDECRAGRVLMEYQPGHPHGFCSAIWMGEVALCQPLYDPDESIHKLKASTSPYPVALRTALVNTFLWEVSFSIDNAQTAISRHEQVHVAGCAYRALCCMAQVLFALNGRYLINEKASLIEAATFICTIRDLETQVKRVWAAIGESDLATAVSVLRAMDRDLHAMVETHSRPGS
ncbi:nucleotidyltransferase domain-containing protein [Paraburkholderia sp. B3]|uniref:nucleotidyltransferase domain-containing protein n=1 Tax=Paraburkholderia sp. B3 TaxID=3134791 RepID=UPI0039826F7B